MGKEVLHVNFLQINILKMKQRNNVQTILKSKCLTLKDKANSIDTIPEYFGQH